MRVGCQTNLSFNVQDFVKSFEYASVPSAKIRLWCSFHPSQVSLEDFIYKCMCLFDMAISFCVGAVGDPRNLDVLQMLREKLPTTVYFWINALKRYPYTQAEHSAFSQIDPLFALETTYFPAEPSKCSAGRESLFVDGDGNTYACPISHVRIGNIYHNGKEKCDKICRAEACSCYLAYVNRRDIDLLEIFCEDKMFRIAPTHFKSKRLRLAN